MVEDIRSKRVLVSGSGTGIGREVALAFARAGADVVFHYSQSDAGAKSGAAEARKLGVRAEALGADFRDVAAVQRLGQQAAEFLGGIDVLVNNAGITMNRPFEETTVEQFDTLYGVNIKAMYFLTQAAVERMLTQPAGPNGFRGVVINMTSVHAYEGMPFHSVYAGTKGAIVAFTRQVAIELAPKGIRVNAIAPGAIEVDNYYKAIPDFDPKAAARSIPAGILGQPSDIAAACVFLASEAARFVVGQTWIIDGGTTSWMPFNEGFRSPLGGQFGKGYVPGV